MGTDDIGRLGAGAGALLQDFVLEAAGGGDDPFLLAIGSEESHPFLGRLLAR